MNHAQNYWIFQASPNQFDINKYLLTTDDYIYWRAKQHRAKMNIGDIVFIWRGKLKNFGTGIIASGIIEESTTPISQIKHPEKLCDHLWKTEVNNNDFLVGIRLTKIKLTEYDGMIVADTLRNNPIMMGHPLITAPRQTNYRLSHEEYIQIIDLWEHGLSQHYITNYDTSAENIDDTHEDAIKGRTDIGETQKKQLSNARRGQGIFRNNVNRNEKKCRVTGVRDMKYLVASHIKPWALSDDVDKLHGANGLLLSPHVDRLFDSGMISFSDTGEILVSKSLDRTILDAWSLDPTKNVGKFKPSQITFLEYHRNHIFKK